jgi:hypothetical protein
MSTTAQDTCVSVTRITDALSRIGDALAHPDLDGLLAAEPELEVLTRALAQATATPADRAQLLPMLRDARLALGRAALLGESLLHAAAATTYAAGAAHGYDREGRASHRSATVALDARG